MSGNATAPTIPGRGEAILILTRQSHPDRHACVHASHPQAATALVRAVHDRMATRYRTDRTMAADSKLTLRVDVDIFTVDRPDAADETLLRLAGNIFQLGTRVGIEIVVTATHPAPDTLPALDRIRSWFGHDVTVDYHELTADDADPVGVEHVRQPSSYLTRTSTSPYAGPTKGLQR